MMQNIRKKLHQSKKYKNKINHLYNEVLKDRYFICANQNGSLNASHLETVRILTNRRIKKIGGQLVIRIKPNIPITKKSTGVRMGKGKGSFKEFIFYTKIDQVLFEFRNVPKDLFMILVNKIKHKLPIKIKILTTTNK